MSVAASAVGLSSSQQEMAAIIEKEFRAAGFSDAVIAAAIVNAIAESNLNPNAVGDSGRSIGLFQLHEKGGGYGMSVADRKNPTLNTQRIIQEAKKAKGFMAVVNSGETRIPVLSAAFSTYVERPANKALAEAHRSALAVRYFPSVETAVVAPMAVLAASQQAPWWAWVGAVSLSLVSLYALRVAIQAHRRVRRDG